MHAITWNQLDSTNVVDKREGDCHLWRMHIVWVCGETLINQECIHLCVCVCMCVCVCVCVCVYVCA